MSKAINCEVCGTTVQPVCWTQHMVGKKHLKMLALVHHPSSSGLHSISVTGFDSNINVARLKMYFKTFGNISRLTMENKKPPYPARYAHIEFEDKESVERILSQSHRFDGCQLIVKPRRTPPSSTPGMEGNKKKANKAGHNLFEESCVVEQMCQLATVDDQMLCLINSLGLDEEDLAKREQLRRSLENTLRSFFPCCRLSSYGSNANNLGLKQISDLDLSLDIGFPVMDDRPAEQDVDAVDNVIANLVNIKRTANYQQFLNTVKAFKLRPLVEIVGAIIHKFAYGFGNICCITKARCPLIQFKHGKSGLMCDISLTSRLSCVNTELVKFYQSLDPRVRPLMFAVRVWATHKSLNVSSRQKLSSYAFSMLVVYYLQTCHPPVLPTVEHLQLLTDQRENIGGWDCHFCRDQTLVAKSGNTDSFEDLLKGFFQFCLEMDWMKTVICLRNGTALPIEQFLNENKELKNFKAMPINIQDPFELDHNLAMCTTEKFLVSILEQVDKACKIVSAGHFAKDTQSERIWGFAALISDEILDSPKVLTNDQKECESFEVLLKAGTIRLVVSNVESKVIIPDEDKRRENIAKLSAIIKDLFARALKIRCYPIPERKDMKRRLSSGSDSAASPEKVRVTESGCSRRIAKSTDVKKQKAEELTSTPVTAADLSSSAAVCFHCEVYHRTWINRKKFRNTFLNEQLSNAQMSLSTLEVEEKVSELIIEDEGGVTPVRPLFNFQCSLNPFPSPSKKLGLQVTISMTTDYKECKGVFVPFLKAYIPKLANQCF